MRSKYLVIGAVICSLFCFSSLVSAEIKIGILAKNGPAKVMKMWTAHGEFLSSKMGDTVTIVPLDFDKVASAVEAAEVDFFLVNSSMFVTMQVKYGAVPVATMVNSRQGKALKSFGGVVLSSAYNDSVNAFDDIKGKAFAAVKKNSFGGWQMAYKEFVDNGIDPYNDFASVAFLGKHDNVVFAIQNEEVEVGTVRTDTLERMVASGSIAMEDFKIIGQKSLGDFPFVCSTTLYPEWPMAKVAASADDVAASLVAALKEIQPTDKAAKAAKIIGWTDPLDYTGVEALQQSLGVGAYAQ